MLPKGLPLRTLSIGAYIPSKASELCVLVLSVGDSGVLRGSAPR